MRLRYLLPMLLLGIGCLLFGLNHLNPDDAKYSDRVSCDGKPMAPGDKCIHSSVDKTEIRDYDEERARQIRGARQDHVINGIIVIVLGSVLTLVSGFLLYWRLRPRPEPAPQRDATDAGQAPPVASPAAADEWPLLETGPDLVRGWRVGPLAEEPHGTVTRVVRGTDKGYSFAVFDYVRHGGQAPASTVWLIGLAGIAEPVIVEHVTGAPDRTDWIRIPGADPGFDLRYRVSSADPSAAQRLLSRKATRLLSKRVFSVLYFDAPGLAYDSGRRRPDGSIFVYSLVASLIKLAKQLDSELVSGRSSTT